MRLALSTLAVPLVGFALYAKMAAFNGTISPGGYNLASATWAMGALATLTALLAFAVPARHRLAGLLVLDALFTLVVLADTVYLRYFGEVLPASALLHGGQSLEVRQSIGVLFKPADLRLLQEWPFLLAMWPWRAHAWRLPVPIPALVPRLAAAAAGVGSMIVLASVIGEFDRRHPNALSGAWNPTYIAASIGTFPYHGVDAYHTLAARVSTEGAPEAVEAMAEGLTQKNSSQATNGNWGVAAGANVIAIQVEALQTFTLHREIKGRAITPHLNRLAAESLYFPNVYGQTKDGNTSDAEFMANTSLYPAPRGAAFVRFSGNTFEALPTALQERGYTTAAMHANSPGFWNRQAMYRSLGFSRFYSVNDYAMTESVGLGLSDRAFFAQSLDKLATLPEPFYAWMVTMSSHHPYDEAAALSDLDVGELAGTRLGLYLQSIHYADAELGRFIADLKRRGLWQRSVVVVHGDHPGVQHDDREALFAFTGTSSERPLAWRKLQKVPLLIHTPGESRRGRIEVAGGQVDLLPTVSNLLGLPFPHAFGQDLLQSPASFVVFNDGSVLSGDTYFDAKRDQAYAFTSERPLDPAMVAPSVALARRHLNYSAEILTYNLVPPIKAIASRGPQRNGRPIL
ncbi:MAG: alkaline phosphatase [Phenylobacterium sp.]|nr:alkaline phosphatase [Phenylobacterium sp.]